MPSSPGPRPIDDVETGSILEPFDRDVLLATGRAVQVRPTGLGDVDRLRAFYSQLSEASSYYRFFGVRRFIPDEELQRATVHDVRHRVTLVCESDGVIIGIGEYHVSARGDEAEVAFAVADAHHHEGVATVLLEDLALIARAAGLRRLVAETLPDNEAMKGVFRSVGLVNRIWFEDGVIQVQLDLTGEHLLQDDADLRDWKAAVRSLRPIIDPSHVVVVGAGQDPESPGARILARLRETFTGRVSGMVSPDGLDELAPAPDVTIIAVPAPEVAEVLDRCGAAGIPAAVVISAGFAETGPDGARMQDDVLAIARRHGMRLVGPNSLGVVSTACGLNASLTSHRFDAGGIAIGSQSGGVGIAIAAEARRRHAGISSFVSMGNKADVSGNDLLRLWSEDDQTTVVLLYLESFGDPVRFARVARAVSKRKPVIALKSGRSAPGVRGALSHTAALASDHGAVDALFAHTGVVRAGTLEELIDVGLLLDRHRAPAGTRVALIGNSRGPLTLGADAADADGLDVPILSASVRDEVASHVPAAASTANPVDLGPGVTPAQLASVIQTIVGSGEVDACIVVHVDVAGPGGSAEPPPVLATSGLDRFPVALSLIGQDRGDDPGPFAVFPTPERAARAVALAARRAGWLSALDGDSEFPAGAPVLDANSFVEARRLARAHTGGAPDTSWLGPAESFALLEAAGVPVAPWRYARSAEECAVAADEIGFPCVVKADVAGVTHKSDVGAVRLGVSDRIIAADAYTALKLQFGDRMRGAVVQAQAVGSLELLVGAIRDPAFGPFVVVGAGGVETDLRDDRIMLVAPVARAAARGAVERLRLAPLFHGFRGRPEVPVDPVVDLVHRIGVLAASVPEIQQLDMNPVLVGPHGCVAVDALVGVAAPRASGPARAMRGAAGFAVS